MEQLIRCFNNIQCLEGYVCAASQGSCLEYGFDSFPRKKRACNMDDELVEVRKKGRAVRRIVVDFQNMPLPSKYSCTSYLFYRSKYAVMPNAVSVYMLPVSLWYENQTIIDTEIIPRLHDR